MLIPALTALGLATGMPPLLAGALGVAALEPRIGVLVTALLVVVAERPSRLFGTVAEGTFHQAVSAELRTGSSLRAALGRAAHRAPELGLLPLDRIGRAGLPVTELQRHLRRRLPETGAATAAALAVLEQTGGNALPIFEALAVLAHEEASLEQERRASTAQARLSGLIIGGLPLCYLGFLLLTGRFGDLARRTPVMVVAGGALLSIGALVMASMLRSFRARLIPARSEEEPRILALLRRMVRPWGRLGNHDGEVDLLAELVFIGLTAGLSLEGALSHAARQLSPALRPDVERLLRSGRQSGLAVALAAASGPAFPLFAILARSQVTGAPPAAGVAAFLAQTRERRKMAALERARKLPVKLLVPLTLFIFPGFVLLTIGPSLIDSLARVLDPLFP